MIWGCRIQERVSGSSLGARRSDGREMGGHRTVLAAWALGPTRQTRRPAASPRDLAPIMPQPANEGCPGLVAADTGIFSLARPAPSGLPGFGFRAEPSLAVLWRDAGSGVIPLARHVVDVLAGVYRDVALDVAAGAGEHGGDGVVRVPGKRISRHCRTGQEQGDRRGREALGAACAIVGFARPGHARPLPTSGYQLTKMMAVILMTSRPAMPARIFPAPATMLPLTWRETGTERDSHSGRYEAPLATSPPSAAAVVTGGAGPVSGAGGVPQPRSPFRIVAARNSRFLTARHLGPMTASAPRRQVTPEWRHRIYRPRSCQTYKRRPSALVLADKANGNPFGAVFTRRNGF